MRNRLGLPCFFSSVPSNISAILFAVRRLLISAIFLLAAGASAVIAREWRDPSPARPAQSQQPQTSPPQDGSPTPANQQAPPAQIVPPSATRPGPIVILDPGHGGTDTGARGPSGALEKDIVLLFARIVRVELEQQGYRVVMTRNDDSNPSYDDRAALANSHRDALYISIHLASTGAVGTVHTYYYQFSSPVAGESNASAAQPPPPPPNGMVRWEEAQKPYVETSHHYADVLEGDLAQHFNGSPAASTGAAVRELRSVAAPAVAVEISSVAVNDPNSLTALAQPLATSIFRSILAFRAAASMGAK